MTRWLIAGGGIHGTHVAARLVEEGGVSPVDITVLDPAPRLLARWRDRTIVTGMTYLRSPAVHHLGLKPFELLRLGQQTGFAPCGLPAFEQPYNRPAVSLFNDHAETVITRTGIGAQHRRATAVEARLTHDRIRAQLDDGSAIEADHLVLAPGAGDQPHWPAWARRLARDGAAIVHLFGSGSRVREDMPSAGNPPPAKVAVIGAGISGVQLALRLASPDIPLMLVSGHPLRAHQFDSEPGWLGPRYMKAFSEERDPARRRAMIQNARNKGSLPPALVQELRDAVSDGRVVLVEGPVSTAHIADGRIQVVTPERTLTIDRVVLATGFDPRRPGGPLVDGLAETYGLRCAACGYPLPDAHLRWHPRVFVTGPLAELELGPVARNIAGARRAASRLQDAVA